MARSRSRTSTVAAAAANGQGTAAAMAAKAGMIDALSKSQAIIEFDMDGTILSANDNFLQSMGYSLPEIVGKHHGLFVDDAMRASPEYKEFWAKLKRGEFQAGQFKRYGKGGRELWLQATYNPILEANGTPVKVVKLAADVTAAVDMQLHAQREQLRLKQMVENATVRILIADRDLNIVYMNPASVRALRQLERLLPCRVEEILGQSIDIFHKNPEQQRRLLSDPRNLPHRASIKLGDEILDLNVSAIRDESGNYIGPMVTWEIITEKVRAEEREQRLVAEQEQAKIDLEEKVNSLMHVVQAAANGDLTQEVPFAGDDDLGRLASSVSKMLNDLRNVIGQVVEASQQQNEGARTIAESSANLSDGSQSQAASV